MLSSNKNLTPAQLGFGLIEIMVGLVIGLLATMVIMQVFSVFEGQKRSTTGSSDAQTNGGIALFTISRDTQMAGFGLPIFDSNNPPLACDPVPTIDHDGDATTPNIDISPVVIADAVGTNGSDSLALRSGPTPMGGVAVKIVGVAGKVISVDNNLGCQNKDIVLVSNKASCIMTSVDDADLTDNTSVTVKNATGIVSQASMACMGAWNESLYEVNGDVMNLNGAPNVSGIVNLQAQYGVSNSAGDNEVTAWVDATGIWAAGTITVANRNRIKAVRIAVVARNDQFEKEDVSQTCSSTTTSTPTGLCAWTGSTGSPAPEIDLSGVADWQRYRYRVFETIIPLRNVIWSKDNL